MKRTSLPDRNSPPPALKLTRPDDLIEAVPYLVGFHPRDSLVLIGLGPGRPGEQQRGVKTVVTVVARLDLVDVRASPEPVDNAVRALVGAASTSAVALIYGNTLELAVAQGGLVAGTENACNSGGVGIGQWIFVGADRWATGGRTGRADDADDCAVCSDFGDRAGSVHPGDDFVFAGPFEHADGSLISATATYAGLVAHPDRAAVTDLLTPESDKSREVLLPALDRARADRLDCSGPVRERRRRADIRALFAATRTLALIDEAQTVRFGAGLADIDVRDACWLAIEAGRIHGDELWRGLSRVLPDRYRAPALFLFGWQQWRSGAGALAGMAVDAALACDPTYHAADLLDGALANGLDPFRTPRLRKGA